MVATYDDVIEQIAQSIFATMLNIDLVRADVPPPADQDLLLASIHIAGAWTGSVVLGLSQEVACASAAAMLQMAAAEVTEADKQDAASELVNMVGGNLKSLLPGPSYLSLPMIVAGCEFGLQMHDAELLEDVVLGCQSGPLRMRLYTKRAAAEG